MPKGPPPQWKRRDCRFDHIVAAGLKRPFGEVLVYGGIDDEARAKDVFSGVRRCGQHRGYSVAAWITRDAAGKYEVRFRLFEKNAGRAHVLSKYGTDRQQWKYNPRRSATAEERETWAARDEKGNIVQ